MTLTLDVESIAFNMTSNVERKYELVRIKCHMDI